METTLKEQIDAVRAAYNLIENNTDSKKHLLSVLNDAASTLASLNLTKDLKSEREIDKDFVIQALNHYWNHMNWNLTEVKDLGDIERQNYEYAKKKAKEQIELLTP